MAIRDTIKGLFGGDKGSDGGGYQKKKLDVAKRFELDRQAASGTMSKFRAAREIATGRMVGLKFLDVEKSKQFEDRFKGLNKPPEGEIAMKFDHPRIVKTFEYGLTTNNEPYILMEYIHGLGLSTVIHENYYLLEGKKLNLIRQMAEAIEAVHQAGFIHRDICPRNFICSEDITWLKLIDFGLTVPDKPEFRQPGNRTGTPLYMAPEIVRRRPTDKRVDIFALGVTCFRMLTSEHPWSSGGDTTGTAALAHDTYKPKKLLDLRPSLDPRLVEAVEKCISAKPEDRPDSAENFLRMIRSVKHEEP